jgi:hypothetical protein
MEPPPSRSYAYNSLKVRPLKENRQIEKKVGWLITSSFLHTIILGEGHFLEKFGGGVWEHPWLSLSMGCVTVSRASFAGIP